VKIEVTDEAIFLFKKMAFTEAKVQNDGLPHADIHLHL